MKTPKKVFVFFILFIALFFLSIPHYSGDVWNHLAWGRSIASEGPYGFYGRIIKDIAFPNYPPLAMLFFTASFLLYKIILAVTWFLNQNLSFFPSNLIYFFESNNVQIAFLKFPTIFTLLGFSWLLSKITPKLSGSSGYLKIILICTILILNPALFYISIVWGQIDLIPIFFLLLSSYFIFEKNIILNKKLVLISLFASLSLLTKQTSIIFWFIQIIFMIKILGVKFTLIFSVLTLLLVYLSYIPFLGINPLNVLGLYMANFTYVAQVTQINSINLWGFLYDFQPIGDNRTFFSLTFNFIGKALFLGILIPILLYVFLKLKNFTKATQFYILIYTFFLTTLLFFLLLTRMHERYLIPAVLFSLILIFYRKFHIYNLVFFSALVFLNLYRGLLEPEIPFLKSLVFSTSFLGLLFLVYFLTTFYNIILFIRTLRNREV